MRIGIVGFGFMGRTHYRCWKELEDVEITAICDSNPNGVEDLKETIGNIAGTAETIDLSKIEIYRDFEKMLADEKLDALSLALPTYLHAEYSIKALDAGMHVLCEKPMALSAADCGRMIEAAARSGKVLQVGHCIRFWPEYAKAKEIVTSGEYGRIVTATFQRLGATPKWAWDNWIMDEQRSGGMVLDLHIHDTDFVHYLCGMPQAVRSFTAEDENGKIMHIVTHYLYDDGKAVTAEGSWAMTPGFGFEMSFNIAHASRNSRYARQRERPLRHRYQRETAICFRQHTLQKPYGAKSPNQ
jgi:predicted dehydrogenase